MRRPVAMIMFAMVLAMSQALAGPAQHLAPKSMGFDEDSPLSRAAYRQFYAQAVEEILRQLPDGTCLSRSFALANRLLDQGIRAMVMMKTVHGEPHFWVETQHGFILEANPGGRKLTRVAMALGHENYMVLDKRDAARDRDYLFYYEHGEGVVKWGDLALHKVLHVQTSRPIVYTSDLAGLADEKKDTDALELMLSRNITLLVLQRMPAYLQEDLSELPSLPLAALPLLKLRARQTGCADFFDYYRSYFMDKPNASEISRLKEILMGGLNNERNRTTWLFRESRRWVQPLRDYVLTLLPLKIMAGDYSLRVKSIGASYGGEAYSVGIVVFDTILRYARETLFAHLPEAEREESARKWMRSWDIRLQGYDNDFFVLDAAAKARFSEDPQFPSADRLADEAALKTYQAWISKETLANGKGAAEYRMDTAVKDAFLPAYIDLSDKHLLPILHQEPAEIVVCRNVMQYLDESLWDGIRDAVYKSRSSRYPSFSFLDMEFHEQGKAAIVLPQDFMRAVASGINVRDWTAYRALAQALITLLEQRLQWKYPDEVEERLLRLRRLMEMPVDVRTAENMFYAYTTLVDRNMADLGWKFLDKAIAPYETKTGALWNATMRSGAAVGMAM